MPTIIDNAIVIRSWDFSETSQTVSLLTREHGIIRGLAKGSKRDKGPFSGGLDVLTQGEVVAIVKPGRDLATITAWHLQHLHRIIRQNLSANRAALYMADLVHHLILEHDPHPELFDALVQALGSLERIDFIEHALLRLQWKLLSEAGYSPELHRDAENGQPLDVTAATLAFSARAGGMVADAAGAASDRWRVRRETVDVLRAIAADQSLEKADSETIRRANRLLAVYFRQIIGSEPPTMSWTFGDLNV